MKKCFIAPDSADKRIPFAVSELEKMGNRKAEIAAVIRETAPAT